MTEENIEKFLDSKTLWVPALDRRDTRYYEDQGCIAETYFTELKLIGDISNKKTARVITKIDKEYFAQEIGKEMSKNYIQ